MINQYLAKLFHTRNNWLICFFKNHQYLEKLIIYFFFDRNACAHACLHLVVDLMRQFSVGM